jgi:peptide/nickel transport system substrate-binding protein
VIFKAVPDAATRLQLLTSGTVQVAEDLGSQERQQLQGKSNVQVVNVPGNFGIILGLNNGIPPFDNKLVRQAVAYAAPVDDIIRTVYLGDPSVRLLKGYTPETYPGHTDYWPYSTDLNKAKSLLQQAGQGPFTMTLTYSNDQQDAQQVAVLLQTQLAKIGITVQLDGQPAAKYSETFFGRKAQTVLVEDALWNGDPGYGLNLYFTTESHADWISYNNPDVTTLISQVRSTLDPKAEAVLAKQTYQKIVDDAPWAFQIGTGYHVAIASNVAGFNWRMSNLIDFSTLYYK